MSCCGNRRAAASGGDGLRSLPARAPTRADAPLAGVALLYRGPLPMVLPSPSGAAPYQLREAAQRLEVPAADAGVLLNTGWFTRA